MVVFAGCDGLGRYLVFFGDGRQCIALGDLMVGPINGQDGDLLADPQQVGGVLYARVCPTDRGRLQAEQVCNGLDGVTCLNGVGNDAQTRALGDNRVWLRQPGDGSVVPVCRSPGVLCADADQDVLGRFLIGLAIGAISGGGGQGKCRGGGSSLRGPLDAAQRDGHNGHGDDCQVRAGACEQRQPGAAIPGK